MCFPGSISDTPPNTPSSFDGGSSTTSFALSSSDSTVRNAPSLAEDIRVAARQPTGGVSAGVVGTENFWIGRLAGKETTSKRPMIKRYWEDNIRKEEKEKARQAVAANQRKTYGFPRWRSNDAMSASLVASAKSTEMIPTDSKIPVRRRQKMEQTEREAEVEKRQIKLEAEPKRLSKGKSLDSLNAQIKVDHRPWYDRQQIKQAISRESIANLSETKSKFEGTTSPSPQLNGWHYRQQMTPIQNSPSKSSIPRQSTPQSMGTQPVNGHTPYHQSAPSDDTIEYALDTDQFLFLQMLRQNMHMVQDFGIILPAKVKNLISELHPVSVEIRQVAEVAPIVSPFSRSHTPTTNGRYVKSHTSSSTNHPRFRRLYDMSLKDVPENKRQSMQELDQIRSGESLIAAEIRTFKEREDELRRSRSELGLPNLEDTIQLWRSGYGRTPSQNSLHTAVSFDQLHQPSERKFSKSGSVDQLDEPLQFTQNSVPGSTRFHRHDQQASYGYRLHRSEDPDVMIYGPSSNLQRMNTDSAVRIVTSPTYSAQQV
ncbi:hypothetical protein QR680_019168 [Steinernema hermaphroditum]|uniref:Uncharacterized protein n=1 Tax=Steinernema hermaphroditum TaxID=289476 RepID=A0AA39HMC8_9BILA|nr:hypothetical protein QR680_019168 [Steinernema hermaphroditum]